MDFNLSRETYYLDFWVLPVAVLGLLILGLYFFGLNWQFFALITAGFGAWTLVEYLIHRSIFHAVLWYAHKMHHEKPSAYIGASPWISLGLLPPAYVVLVVVLGAAGIPLMVGLVIGYFGYIALHDLIHHKEITPQSCWYKAKMRHLRHHAGEEVNFGVMFSFWDRLFGTFKP